MKKTKRILAYLLCMLLVCCTIPISASAIELSYWEETKVPTYTVGRFKSKTITYSYQKFNTDSNFLFNDAVVYARNQWSSALGIDLQYKVLMSDAQVKVYGGTFRELDAMGIVRQSELTTQDFQTVSIPAKISSTKRSLNYTFRNKNVDIYEITGAKIFVIQEHSDWERPEVNRDKKSAIHQMGHALGWFGHSASYDMTMYSYQGCSPVDRNHINLHTYDKRHLKQIYDITNF